MSNGDVSKALYPTTTTFNPVGIMCTANPIYPPVVNLGAPRNAEWGPHAVPPGCAFGLPTLQFGGPWQH